MLPSIVLESICKKVSYVPYPCKSNYLTIKKALKLLRRQFARNITKELLSHYRQLFASCCKDRKDLKVCK